jgi:hypothetical protein
LETSPGGLEDLLAASLSAFISQSGHDRKVTQTERIFYLDIGCCSCYKTNIPSIQEIQTMSTVLENDQKQVNRSAILAVVCIALGAVSAAMASLNVAIPDLVRSTHATQTQLEWIIDAYLLVFSVMLLAAGALGDRYGRRKALIGGC